MVAHSVSYPDQGKLRKDSGYSIKTISESGSRRIVTSHDAFTYYGDAYGVDFAAPQSAIRSCRARRDSTSRVASGTSTGNIVNAKTR